MIQVSNVCELRQNSTYDDFLPIEVMDKIVEEAVNEESKIEKMIEDFNGEQVLDENVNCASERRRIALRLEETTSGSFPFISE